MLKLNVKRLATALWFILKTFNQVGVSTINLISLLASHRTKFLFIVRLRNSLMQVNILGKTLLRLGVILFHVILVYLLLLDPLSFHKLLLVNVLKTRNLQLELIQLLKLLKDRLLLWLISHFALHVIALGTISRDVSIQIIWHLELKVHDLGEIIHLALQNLLISHLCLGRLLHLTVNYILNLWCHRLERVLINLTRLSKIHVARRSLLDQVMLGSLLYKMLLKELLLRLS